jgi:alpha-mannosidase
MTNSFVFFASLEVMDQYPEYHFACSQAQQFDWLKQTHPTTYEKLKLKVKSGQLIPIGGTWVEMDGNLPSGESFVRQFLYGQRFFQSEFGFLSQVFWLPDTFGYSAQLPQLVKLSQMKYFFTQKLSWNNINRFQHTSFLWEALDGTSVVTHFCPANTYCGQMTVREMAMHLTNHKDLAVSNKSLYLFGNGDGGGGPTKDMLERQRRFMAPKGTAGVPTVTPQDPLLFYQGLEKDADKLPHWNGELYFELHRGTYTSQANTKQGNRESETLLRNVELVWTLLNSLSAVNYPREQIERMWKNVLLNQFHDVLPGSSIECVYKDAEKVSRILIQ